MAPKQAAIAATGNDAATNPVADAGAGQGESVDNVKLLLSAIANQKDGKIDYKGVADECGIVSAAAAQKRVTRLQAKYDMKPKPATNGSGTNGNDKAPVTSKSTRKKGENAILKSPTASKTPRSSAAKKRKIKDAVDDEDAVEANQETKADEVMEDEGAKKTEADGQD